MPAPLSAGSRIMSYTCISLSHSRSEANGNSWSASFHNGGNYTALLCWNCLAADTPYSQMAPGSENKQPLANAAQRNS